MTIILLLGVGVWIVGLVLLLEVTQKLLDVLMYVMEIGQMS